MNLYPSNSFPSSGALGRLMPVLCRSSSLSLSRRNPPAVRRGPGRTPEQDLQWRVIGPGCSCSLPFALILHSGQLGSRGAGTWSGLPMVPELSGSRSLRWEVRGPEVGNWAGQARDGPGLAHSPVSSVCFPFSLLFSLSPSLPPSPRPSPPTSGRSPPPPRPRPCPSGSGPGCDSELPARLGSDRVTLHSRRPSLVADQPCTDGPVFRQTTARYRRTQACFGVPRRSPARSGPGLRLVEGFMIAQDSPGERSMSRSSAIDM